MNNSSNGYESIPDESLRIRKRDSLLRYTRPLFIITLLVWGIVVLLKIIQNFTGINDGNSDDKYHLPNPLVTNDGSLKVSFENVRNGTFQPVYHSLQWIKNVNNNDDDNGLYLTDANNTFAIRSVFDKDYEQVLLNSKTFKYQGSNFSVDSLVASPNLEQLLIRTNTVSNWRHSTFGSYFVYDKNSEVFYLIGDNIALAEWSPNSYDIAFVQDNDIYIYSTKAHSVVNRVTDDGSSQIFNGKPDWVYEEEVFEGDRALWWSIDGSYLAFARIDETKVGEFILPYYVQHEDDIYPEMRTIKYPKSGTNNPDIDILIYDTYHKSTFKADINLGSKISPVLLTEVIWVGNDTVLAKTTDRSSDILTVLLINAKEQTTNTARVHSSDDGWWEITHTTMFIPSDASKGRLEDGYIDVLPINGYNHLVYFTPSNSSKPIVLTEGSWEVVNGPSVFDNETGDIYFIGTKKSSTERHIYGVNINSPKKVYEVTDTTKPGVFTISFSSGAKAALLTYMGPSIPYQKIVDLKAIQKDSEIRGNTKGRTLYYLEENDILQENMKKYSVPVKTFDSLHLGNDSYGNEVIANSFEIVPNDFDPKRKDYYPVFFYAYGGPNSQQVLQTFSVGFNEVVASQLGAFVVVVDGRGTGFKGQNFRSIVRDNLGDLEAVDQIAAASIYASKDYIDAEKISLFGWSYGGYLTLKTLEKDGGEHFKYGLSVAPVTDWRFYDSVYTERYMHTPQENSEGYFKSSVHNVTNIAEAKRFLLMHGTGDDNVHFQNSLKFLDLLDIKGIENYDVHVFPDSDHSIRFHNANNIVYDKLLNWAKQAFNGDFVKLR
ncbi:hypothetical protein Kpol_1051p23 [Vanderwaltozyma polyspora DSM 70294]|uniref:Dipeptidyl aminopeptidase B n=1 Tax=Vanderwaltozyma polyspora (strain ATCC 22028 / DSM 70294 / BCRC 21397 / CBS 2163 / NBRC 10782 / NRRL Y-8283 / UCD 57-17) TaxID=436907 RepID=A7TMY6_VANPO|nr:uncharacterized protein Kpol_1051p23 [Vanderwaltozyma polyspora DSM 70294]EDO16374.1 hypothetical protein Kpol_1051p23 [Vanderwaltozyma polyspora DSM 70294]